MRLVSVSAKNFLSLGDVSLDFSTYDGVPIVFTGGNGHGKSSIFEAVVYALTGKTHRGLRGSSVVKRGKSGSTEVGCLFDTEHGELEVLRYRNDRRFKNSVRVIVDGVELTKGTSELTQRYLYSILGFTESSLMASILFGQNAMGVSSFSDANLKTLVEAILGIMDYQRAQVEAKQEASVLKAEISGLNNQLNFLKEEVSSMSNSFQDQSLKKEEMIKEKEKEVETLKNDGWVLGILKTITSLCQHITSEKIKDVKGEAQKSKVGYQDLMRGVSKLKAEKNTHEKEILKATKLISLGKCPTCYQPIMTGHSHLSSIIKESEEKKEGSVLKLRDQEEKMLASSQQEAQYDTQLKYLGDRNMNLVDKRFDLQSKIKSIKWEISSLKKEITTSFPDFEELKKRIESYKFKIYNIKTKLKNLERNLEEADFWVEGFGPSGLRNHLVYTILPGLNSKIEEYLKELSQGDLHAEIDSQITKKGEIKFDKLKTRVWLNNKEVELNSCSGGERRKIDIALGLALGDISGIGTLLFDEWFTDLDSSAMDSTFRILDRLCRTRRVLIATHHERFTESHIVTKVGDTTTIKEVN